MLALDVADADAVFAQAVAAGAEVRQPLADMFWGDRTASSTTRSGIAGTSLSIYATCHMTRSLPPPHRPSPESVTDRGGTSGLRASELFLGNDLARLRPADAHRTVGL